MAPLPHRLKFHNPKTPYSEHFGDVYFANDVGIEESIYVYLEGSGALSAIREGKEKINIAEIGFGVGLNFLLTLRAFLTEGKSTQILHYVSVEKYPVAPEDLRKLYGAYPELLPYAEMLLDQYPLLVPGIHRLFFEGARVILDLMIGDASESYAKSDFKADFWYFDGFAPSKNPDAFSEALFAAVRKRSAPNARGRSFTAAGWVRRSLATHGFQVLKKPGFGKKRECIEATLLEPNDASEKDANPEVLPWFSRKAVPVLKSGERVAVLGAGLAGSAIARALAERGFSVSVFDGNGIAGRASSNSAALFNVQLSRQPNPISDFSQSSLAHFLREQKALGLPARFGILRKGKEAAACLKACHYPENFYEALPADEIFLPDCGMIHPGELCRRRLSHDCIRVIKTSIQQVKKAASGFELLSGDESHGNFNHVVYALGADLTLGVSPLAHDLLRNYPLSAVRGQTIRVAPIHPSSQMKFTRVETGYVTPLAPEITGHSEHLIGATYQIKGFSEDQIARDTEKLLKEAAKKWGEFRGITPASLVSYRVGYRASAADKLPLIGPLCDRSMTAKQYAHALKGARFPGLPPLAVCEGEWIFMGLGSRGVTFSSLGAEILASQMTGMPLPIFSDLLSHLHPVRFAIRGLRKGSGTSFAPLV